MVPTCDLQYMRYQEPAQTPPTHLTRRIPQGVGAQGCRTRPASPTTRQRQRRSILHWTASGIQDLGGLPLAVVMVKFGDPDALAQVPSAAANPRAAWLECAIW